MNENDRLKRTECPKCGTPEFVDDVSRWMYRGRADNNIRYRCKECKKDFRLYYRPELQAQEKLNKEEKEEQAMPVLDEETSLKKLEGVLQLLKGKWISKTDACKQAKITTPGFFETVPKAGDLYYEYVDKSRLDKLSNYLEQQSKKLDPNSFLKLLQNPANICSQINVGIGWFSDCVIAKDLIEEYQTQASAIQHENVDDAITQCPMPTDDESIESVSLEEKDWQAYEKLLLEEIEAQKNQLIQNESEIKMLLAQIQSMPIEVNNDLKSKLEFSNSSIANLNDELARSKAENEQLRQKVTLLQSEISSNKVAYANLVQENQRIRSQSQIGTDGVFEQLVNQLTEEVKQKETLLSAAKQLQGILKTR